MDGPNVIFHPIISFIQKMALYETKMVKENRIFINKKTLQFNSLNLHSHLTFFFRCST